MEATCTINTFKAISHNPIIFGASYQSDSKKSVTQTNIVMSRKNTGKIIRQKNPDSVNLLIHNLIILNCDPNGQKKFCWTCGRGPNLAQR